MPEKILKKINDAIMPQQKVCFISCLIVGLFAHFYKITNWLPNWDSLVFRHDAQNMLGLGRWFLPVVCSISSFYDLPFLNGILSIIFHGLGAVYICKIFNVENKITAFLIGGMIATFPTVTSVMMYNYVADGYSIAFFLATLSAYYMTREKPKYILSAVFIALSTGIYQAYITVTIVLILGNLIDRIIYQKTPANEILKKILFMGLTGIFGMALYSLILKGLLIVFSKELMDYQGINSSSSMSNLDLLGSLYIIKETFLNLFFDLTKGIGVYFIINVFVFAFAIFYHIKGVVVNKVKPLGIILAGCLSVMLIIGAGILAFINSGIDYHNLMLMGYSVFYLFFLILYERKTEMMEKAKVIKCWILLVGALGLIVNQVVIANVSYHKAQMAYEKSYGVLIRIADRIEQLPEADMCEEIVVVGALKDSQDYSVNLPPEITGITDGHIIRADDETVGQSIFTDTINDYCGKNYTFLSGDEKTEILKREDVENMGIWPHKDCLKVIDKTLVIKLGTEGEK